MAFLGLSSSSASSTASLVASLHSQAPVRWRTKSLDGEDIIVSAFSCTTRGKREKNEDSLATGTTPDALVTAVFDGHYGGKCSKWCARKLPKHVLTELAGSTSNPGLQTSPGSRWIAPLALLQALTLSITSGRSTGEDRASRMSSRDSREQSEAELRVRAESEATRPTSLSSPTTPRSLALDDAALPRESQSAQAEVLRRCVLELDERWLSKAEAHRPPYEDGTTATVLLLTGGLATVANTGDSRTVACVNGRALPLSSDHTGKREDERARVEGLGGQVSVTGRVRGKLMVTRALGDLRFKQGLHEVIADPELAEVPLSKELQFVLLACDGIWDVFASAEAIKFCRKRLPTMKPKRVVEALIEAAYEHGSEDNLSAILVVFDYGDGQFVDHGDSSDGSDGANSEDESRELSEETVEEPHAGAVVDDEPTVVRGGGLLGGLPLPPLGGYS